MYSLMGFTTTWL